MNIIENIKRKIGLSPKAKESPKSYKITTEIVFTWGKAVVINTEDFVNFYIDVYQDIFESDLIKSGDHVSMVDSISAIYCLRKYLTDSGHVLDVFGKNKITIKRQVYPFRLNLPFSTLSALKMSDESFAFPILDKLNTNCLYPFSEQGTKGFIEEVLLNRIRMSVVDDFEQEITQYNKELEVINFNSKINEQVIKDSFIYVIDIVPDSNIEKRNNGFLFSVPMISTGDSRFNFDEKTSSILYELAEGINKIRSECESQCTISFSYNSINISIDPRYEPVNYGPYADPCSYK